MKPLVLVSGLGFVPVPFQSTLKTVSKNTFIFLPSFRVYKSFTISAFGKKKPFEVLASLTGIVTLYSY